MGYSSLAQIIIPSFVIKNESSGVKECKWIYTKSLCNNIVKAQNISNNMISEKNQTQVLYITLRPVILRIDIRSVTFLKLIIDINIKKLISVLSSSQLIFMTC